jgi:hypothetical protein
MGTSQTRLPCSVGASPGGTPEQPRSGGAVSIEAAAEEPASEHFSEHFPALRAFGNFMELPPQASPADQEQFISGYIGPWNVEYAFFLSAIRTRID